MKTATAELRAALAADVKTLAWLVKVTRTDGTVMGFTTHDRSLVVGGTTYKATTAFSPSKTEQQISMGVDNAEIQGMLSDDAITDEDLAGGLYDRARIDHYVCDWTAPQWGVEARGRFFVGEVTRRDSTWTMQLIGLKELLQKQVGRVLTPECSHTLGDARCGVDLPSFQRIGTVTFFDGVTTLFVDGLADLGATWARFGYLRFKTGRNAFARIDVKESDGAILELWKAPPFPVMVGDELEIYPGCGKRIAEDCHGKFNNRLRFGGFPQVPGADKAYATANTKDPEQE